MLYIIPCQSKSKVLPIPLLLAINMPAGVSCCAKIYFSITRGPVDLSFVSCLKTTLTIKIIKPLFLYSTVLVSPWLCKHKHHLFHTLICSLFLLRQFKVQSSYTMSFFVSGVAASVLRKWGFVLFYHTHYPE